MTQYTKMANKMQLCRIIYYSLPALSVSSDIFARHQEHLNCVQLLVLHTYVAAGWYHGSVGTDEVSSNTPMIPGGNTCVISEAVIQFRCS